MKCSSCKRRCRATCSKSKTCHPEACGYEEDRGYDELMIETDDESMHDEERAPSQHRDRDLAVKRFR